MYFLLFLIINSHLSGIALITAVIESKKFHVVCFCLKFMPCFNGAIWSKKLRDIKGYFRKIKIQGSGAALKIALLQKNFFLNFNQMCQKQFLIRRDLTFGCPFELSKCPFVKQRCSYSIAKSSQRVLIQNQSSFNSFHFEWTVS